MFKDRRAVQEGSARKINFTHLDALSEIRPGESTRCTHPTFRNQIGNNSYKSRHRFCSVLMVEAVAGHLSLTGTRTRPQRGHRAKGRKPFSPQRYVHGGWLYILDGQHRGNLRAQR